MRDAGTLGSLQRMQAAAITFSIGFIILGEFIGRYRPNRDNHPVYTGVLGALLTFSGFVTLLWMVFLEAQFMKL